MTKMGKSLIILLFVMACVVDAFSQNNNFKVFYSQGNAIIITGKQKKPAQRDMTIKDGQVLKLEKNTSVILIATDGTALPLSFAGSYPFKNLLKLLDENSKSLTNRYFTYVVQEMAEAHEKPEDKLTGGVYRAEKLMRMPFDSCLVIQDSIRFSWAHGVSSDLLFLTLWDQNGRNIFSKPLRDTTFNHKVSHENTDLTYKWEVSYEPEKLSDALPRAYTVASLSTINRLSKDLAELKKSLTPQPEFNELVILNFYNRNHLYIEEYKTIIDALAKYPGSTLLQDYYTRFLSK